MIFQLSNSTTKQLSKLIVFFAVLLGCFFVRLHNVSADNVTDSDMDGISDQLETQYFYTNPNNIDTDGDSFDDRTEIYNGFSPWAKDVKLRQSDVDGDGLNDDWEIKLGTDLKSSDTDSDSYSDYNEVINGYSPTDPGSRKVEKKIAVNIATFDLEYYNDGVKLDSFKVSTGRNGWPTPRGEFTVLDKVPSKNYGGGNYGFYYPNTKWNLHFTTAKNKLRYFIHGAYWHDEFGKKNMSSGCVNVRYNDMEDLYNWASIGTKVVIK